MVPVCFPSKISSTTGLREAVVFALPSVTGLVRWTDYIPVKLVASADAALEGRTDAGGFIPMDMLSSNTGLMGWVDYLPVYVDNSATDAWAITATGFIPYAASGGGSSPAFTVTMTALSNALGTVTTNAYINGGGGGGGTITIPAAASIASRSSGKEMLAVYFDASGTTHSTITDPEHELFYAWDFGDDVGETWAYGTDTTRNKNVAYGPQAAHVYKTAGTKTWALVVIDGSGGTATRTGTVTVSAWTEAETIYVANGATPTAGSNGVGSGAAGYYNETTWAGVVSRWSANKRIRLSNASTWAVTTTNTAPNGMQIDGYGSGSAWNVTTGSMTYGAVIAVNSRSDVRIIGGKHTGLGYGLDSVEAVTVGGGAGGTGISNILMMNMESTATYGLYASSSGAAPDGIFMVGCNVHDIGLNATGDDTGAIPMYIEDVSRMAILGSRCVNVQTSHITRIAGVERGVFANNNFEDPRDRPASTVAVTHGLTIRGFTNHSDATTWNNLWTEKVVVRDNVFKAVGNAAPMLHMGSQNDFDASRLRNCIAENNYFELYNARGIWSKVSSRCTIRNNIFKIAKANWAIAVEATSDVGSPPPTSTGVYNNTCWKTAISDITGDGFTMIYSGTEPGAGSITGLVVKNNLLYDTFDIRTLGWAGSGATVFEYGGSVTATTSNNSTDTQVKNTRPWAATSPAAYADYTPNTGSYAKDGGTSVPVVKDFFNATITGTREIGAIQA